MSRYPWIFYTALFLLAASTARGATVFFGPTNYFSAADSPFDLSGLGTNFWLDDFEDLSLNTPGVTSINGAPRAPSSLTDSVDGDDGAIDGDTDGACYMVRPGILGVSFVFDPVALGGLPTNVGIVVTDGYGQNGYPQATAEFYDANDNLIGTLNSLYQNFDVDTTDDDWFLGIYHPTGVSRIRLWNYGTGSTNLEVDHLQYGYPVPEASTFMLAVSACLVGVARLAIGGSRRSRVPDFHDGLKAQLVADAVIDSYAQRRWVEIGN